MGYNWATVYTPLHVLSVGRQHMRGDVLCGYNRGPSSTVMALDVVVNVSRLGIIRLHMVYGVF